MRDRENPSKGRGWIFFVLLIGGLVIAYGVLYLFTNAFQMYPMTSQAMIPAIRQGHVAVINNLEFRFRHDPQRNDIVTYRRENEEKRTLWLHRIVGLPGETISIRDKVLSVNGTPVEEPFVSYSDPTAFPDIPAIPEPYRLRDHMAPLTLGSDEYFLLGDNRDDSYDSRHFGPVKRNAIKGKVVKVISG